MSFPATTSRQWTRLRTRIAKQSQFLPGPSSEAVHRSLHISTTTSNEASSSSYSYNDRRSRPSSSSSSAGPSRDAGKAYDGLLSSPEAFSRTEAARAVRRGTTRERPGYPFTASPPRYTPAKDTGSGRLTSSEVGMWTTILQDAFDLTSKADAQRSSSGSQDRGGNEGFTSRINDFARRNDLLASFNFRGTQRKKRTLGGGAGRFAILPEGEGVMPDISPEEREAGVDEAVQAMNLCTNEAELWSWAAVNIWGFDGSAVKAVDFASPTRQKIVSSDPEVDEAAAETDLSDDHATSTPSEPRFGVTTAFYPSVLHRLLIHFRDRLRSPTSAICVPRITRALGTRSLVLGCTPELYAEAIKARWIDMKDLRGCLETLKEAKDLGFLVRDRGDAKVAEDARSLPGVVNMIQTEVRRSILGKRAAAAAATAAAQSTRAESFPSLSDLPYQPATSTPKAIDDSDLSLAALDALRIVDEMSTLLGHGVPSSGVSRAR